jgi:hypothetical protein
MRSGSRSPAPPADERTNHVSALLTVIPVGVVGMILAGGEYNGYARHMRVVDCENVSLPQTIAEDSAGGDPGQAADEAFSRHLAGRGLDPPNRAG